MPTSVPGRTAARVRNKVKLRSRLERNLEFLRRMDSKEKAELYHPLLARESWAEHHLRCGVYAVLLRDPRAQEFFAESARAHMEVFYMADTDGLAAPVLDNGHNLMIGAILSGDQGLAREAAHALQSRQSLPEWLPAEGHFAMALAGLVQGHEQEAESEIRALKSTARRRRHPYLQALGQALSAIAGGDEPGARAAIQRAANYYRQYCHLSRTALDQACLPAMAIRELARWRGLSCAVAHHLLPELPR